MTFRRVSGSRFVTDYLNFSLVATGGLGGGSPITATIVRGGDGLSKTATLTKSGTVWTSADSSLSMTIATSTSTDGINGVTAQITCPSFGLTSFKAQAVQPTSGSSSYASSAMTPISSSSGDDQGSPLGALHATYADLEYHDNKEDVTALAIEVEGPEELISKDDFRIQTLSGDRKIFKKNGKYYLATAEGTEPESLLFISNSDTPAGDEGLNPPPKHEEEKREDGALAFAKGFGAGAIGGGGALVTGTMEVVATVATLPYKFNKAGIILLLSWVSEDAEKITREGVEEQAANAETAAEVTAAVAKLLIKIQTDKLALYHAIFDRNIGEKDRILGEYAIYADIGSEFFNELMDDHESLDDYHKGVCAGRIFFEVALIVLPMVKAAQAGNAAGSISKVSAMERIANNINASKWLEKFPLNLKGKINRVIEKVRFTAAKMRRSGILGKGKYGPDGERIWTLMYHYQNKAGKSPLEALVLVEKNHKGINQKALSAFMLDAIVEEKALAFYVRADGARIPKEAWRHLASEDFVGHVDPVGYKRYLDEVKRTGLFPEKTAGSNPYYFGYEEVNIPTEAMSHFQLPKEFTDAKLRVKFDTKEIMDDIEIPRGRYMRDDYPLEPKCVTWPDKGNGGGSQSVTKRRLKLLEFRNLTTGETITYPR